MNVISSTFGYSLTLERRIIFEVFKVDPLCMQFCVLSSLKTDSYVLHERQLDYSARI